MKFFLAFSVTLFLASAHSLFATVTLWPGDGSSLLPPLTGNITIEQQQLLIDGVPFVMKGVCYEPMRPGQTIPDGIMTLHPTEEELAIIERDFQMMQAAGINTIRTYEPITDPSVLALLSSYHLRTIVPICPSQASYQDQKSMATTIELLKKEPSTLLWEIGNEWNLNHFYTSSSRTRLPDGSFSPAMNGLSNEACLQVIQEVAQLIRNKDTLHPISTDIIFMTALWAPSYSSLNIYTTFPDFVDLYGVNFYNGLSFGSSFSNPADISAFALWKEMIDKPFYLGEFGTDAWNSKTNAYDPDDQSMAIVDLTATILNNLSALNPDNILVGGCVFEWCDEWWKGSKGSLLVHGHEGIPLPYGGPWPDHTHNVSWFGIVDVDRNPRQAYWALKKKWSQGM